MPTSAAQSTLDGRSPLRLALDRLIPAELLESSDSRTRARVLVAASVGTGVLGMAIVILRAISFPWGLGLAISAVDALVLLLIPWIQWMTKSNRLAGGILSVLLLVSFPILQLLVGVFPAPALFLFALIPLFSTFFVGVRFGGAATLLSAGAVALLSAVVPHTTDPQLLPLMTTMTACAVTMPMMAYVLAFFYERSRVINEHELARVNAALEVARGMAETADQRKTEFLRHMSHELRTPLNAILGYSELLREEATDREDAALLGDLDHIHSASEHLLRLINNLLDISRIEADAIELDLEDLELPELIDEVSALLRPLAVAGGNQLRIDVDADATIRGDRQRLKQILVNLVANACKFTKDGTIELLVAVEGGDQICFRIRDTGVGIAPKDLERIFEPFAQVSADREAREKGSGLGLAITRKLVELAGGTIDAESSVGRGTTFAIRLPRGGPPER
jgi:signal transduction histidine kinase